MRQFLFSSFLGLSLVITAGVGASTAHAATCTAGWGTDLNGDTFQQDGTTPCTPGASSGSAAITNTPTADSPCLSGQTQDQAGNCVIDAAAEKTATDNKESKDEGYNYVMIKIMSLFAWLLGVAALALNYAVYYTVVTMGDYVHNLAAIGVTWRILRDIGNIMLIFGFLAAGITTILNVSWYGGGKKMIPMLLVAAVFLNFSLFISEAIIDTGNLFATQFYTQINGGTLPTQASLSASSVASEGISNKIMSQLGLQTLYGQARDSTVVFKGANPWFIGFMGILLFLVTAFVMFSLAFILIARFVVLLFLIILAPVGFAGLAVPKLANTASKWWSALFEQTITAPVLLLTLYIALAVITDAQFLTLAGGKPDWTGTMTGNLTGFAGVLLSFLVAMGLLLAVTIFSKKLSAFGAGWASKSAGSLTFGLTAAGMRTTAGWGSQAASQAIRRSKFGSTKLGRVAATTFDKGAKATFDMRNVGIGGGLKGIGVDAGASQAGGYRARVEKNAKAHEEYAKSLTGREKTKEEEAKIAAAEAGRKEAENTHEAAKGEHESTTQQIAVQKAIIERLGKEKERNEKFSVKDPELDKRLEAARANLATSEAGIVTAEEKLKKATEDLATKRAEEAKTTAEIKLASSDKGARLAYGTNIQNSPLSSWAMFGSGGQTAAKKIIKEATKSSEQQMLDTLKKALEKAGEEKPKEEGKPEEKKPEAPK